MLFYYLVFIAVFIVVSLVARVVFSLFIIRDQNRRKAERNRKDSQQKPGETLKSARSEVKEATTDQSEDLTM